MSTPTATISLKTLFSNYLSHGYEVRSVKALYDREDVRSRIHLGTQVIVGIIDQPASSADECQGCGCCQDLVCGILNALSCGSCGTPCWETDKEEGVKGLREVTLVVSGRYQYNNIQVEFEAFKQQGQSAGEMTPLMQKKEED